MSRIGTTDYLIEVGFGEIPGNSSFGAIGIGNSTTTIRDMWGGPGDMVYPTAAETWEIVSDSASDAAAGVGARLVALTSLDGDLLEQVTLVTLNGTTPVTLSNSHFRPQSSLAVTSGSTNWNVGTITIRVSGGGDVRSVIAPTVGLSTDTHFTIPANKKAVILQNFIIFPKNADGPTEFRFRDATTTDASWLSTGRFPLYQNLAGFEVLAKFPLAPGTDTRARTSVSTGSHDVVTISEFHMREI